MNALRTADVTARVVTWHNRHPLASRISPDHVSGIGIVALPFALRVPAEGSETQAATADLTPIFSDAWMFHAAPQRLYAWVRRHGVYPLAGATHWPLRQIDADLPLARRADAQGLEGRTVRHLVTAVIDIAGQRVRVLLTPQASMRDAAVFGSRVHSLRRATALAGASAALGLALGLLPGLEDLLPAAGHGPATAAEIAASGASAPDTASVAAAASVASSAPEPPAASAPPVATEAASAPAPVAAAPVSGTEPARLAAAPSAVPATSHGARTPAASAPLPQASAPAPLRAGSAGPVVLAEVPLEIVEPADVEPQVRDRASGAAPLVRIRPELTEEERRQARLRSSGVRPAAVGAKATVYAIVTPSLRTRVDAEAQQVLLQGLMAQTATPVPTHLDVMAAKGRWRVVWWPHPQQKQAEQLLLQARARGLKVELIAF